MSLELNAIVTILVMLGVIILFALNRIQPERIMLIAVLVLLLFEVISTNQALSGFSNQAVFTIAFMYVVSHALNRSGLTKYIGRKIFHDKISYRQALLRLLIPASLLSAFMNNTPVMSMFIPVAQQGASESKISSSKLLLPLSYACILGGMITLVGSSTNLILSGLMLEKYGKTLQIFSITPVGLVIFIFGFLIIYLIGPFLFQKKTDASSAFSNRDDYTYRMKVDQNGTINGKSIEEAGLRHLKHSYLFEVQRKNLILSAVRPETIINHNDVLLFAGNSNAAAELRAIKGLSVDDEDCRNTRARETQLEVSKIVVSYNFPFLEQKIRDMKFREKYGVVVLAVSRHGERIKDKPGNIRLRPGDVLLVEGPKESLERAVNNFELLFSSSCFVDDNLNQRNITISITTLILMILAVIFELTSLFLASFLAAFVLLASKVLSFNEAKRSIDFSVLLVIACSFSLGEAVHSTGIDSYLAKSILFISNSEIVSLIGLYLATILLTEQTTNSAAIAIMFPVSIAISEVFVASPMPFIMTTFFAASCSFLSPLGYQTNLMVYGPGGYKLTDYIRAGLPLTVISGIVTVTFVPMVWPFQL